MFFIKKNYSEFKIAWKALGIDFFFFIILNSILNYKFIMQLFLQKVLALQSQKAEVLFFHFDHKKTDKYIYVTLFSREFFFPPLKIKIDIFVNPILFYFFFIFHSLVFIYKFLCIKSAEYYVNAECIFFCFFFFADNQFVFHVFIVFHPSQWLLFSLISRTIYCIKDKNRKKRCMYYNRKNQ
jgi:hypothetical protein